MLVENVKFACFNKNDWLDDYKSECDKQEIEPQQNEVRMYEIRNWRLETVKVMKTIELSDSEFDDISHDLLNDREDMFECIGGVEFDEDTNKTKYTYAVKVVNKKTKEVFYVNTEGHKYARYIGLPTNDEAEEVRYIKGSKTGDWFPITKENMDWKFGKSKEELEDEIERILEAISK
jgi:hypothetical protein